MKTPRLFLLIITFATMAAACGDTPTPAPPSATSAISTLTLIPTLTSLPVELTSPATVVTCTPTLDDGLSPSYKPNTPIRSSVGQGHVLEGIVRSSQDCSPIANAQVELWPEYAGQGHPDEARATVFTDRSGYYRFECDPPEHIHMRIYAPGFQTIAQNSYHPEGEAKGIFDIVLEPTSP